MANLRETLASASASDRHDNIIPAHVLLAKRRQRAERQRLAASTIVAEVIAEAAP